MPSFSDYLHQFARELYAKAPQLESELAEIEKRKIEIERELEAAHLALQRASNFIPMSGITYYCPKCWLFHGRQSAVREIPSDRGHVDLYRCNDCNSEYEIG